LLTQSFQVGTRFFTSGLVHLIPGIIDTFFQCIDTLIEII